MNKKNIIIIGGPTASGKTDLALSLAKQLPIEIINADSRQVYKYMDIGTAKPTAEEMAQCPHHLIDFLEPIDYYSAGRFGDDADLKVDEIISRGNIPLVVGGSGLYIKSLCEGFFEENLENDELVVIREQLENELLAKGKEALYKELQEVDKVSALKYIDRNPRRIIRALSHYRLSGIPFSVSHSNQKDGKDYECHYLAIDLPREVLYEKINKRVLIMWEQGLLEETKALLDKGFDKNLNALNTVGYKETIEHIEGRISKDEAISKIQQNTRHYAKRQLTWFRNQYQQMNWIQGNRESGIGKILDIVSFMTKK